MRTIAKSLQLLLLLSTLLVPAFADVPSPESGTRKQPNVSNLSSRMSIRPDQSATEAKLIIPRGLLTQLRTANGDAETGYAGNIAALSNLSRTQTIVGGLFLSLAAISAGIWFLGPRKENLKVPPAALSIALVAVCGFIATIGYANIGPPPEFRSLDSKILVQQAQKWGASGQVKVELVDGDGAVTLVLPKQAGDLPK